MDHLRAAILRPQLAGLPERCRRWNDLYAALALRLAGVEGLQIPEGPSQEQFVGNSIQFSLPQLTADEIAGMVTACAERGVVIKWFGAAEPSGYTSRHDSWRYLTKVPSLPNTDRICSTLCDIRIPLTFEEADCHLIGEIVADELNT